MNNAKPEPTITLSQLAEELKRYEGQLITNGAGLAITIVSSAGQRAKHA